MSTPSITPFRRQLRHEFEALRGQWGWFLALGIALIVLGTIAISVPAIMTITTVVFFGVILLMGGLAEALGAFWARDWGGFFIQLLIGVFYLILGFLFVASPGAATLAATLLIAAFLIVGGIFKIAAALSYHFPGWGWVAASGAITLVLGILIWAEWPSSAPWVIGLFVGIEMLLNGWWWVMIALAVQKLPRPTPP